ncbi:MAG: nuclear transport factor 2 family protein [Gemmatimonadaceae bacterium]|nr:nuclear transport factor 2 family protein [Gemmatimonadaceae bacterium]
MTSILRRRTRPQPLVLATTIASALVMLACTAPPAALTPATLAPADRAALADSVRAFAAGMVATIDSHNVDGFIAHHLDGPDFAWATYGAMTPLDSHHVSMRAYFPSDAGKNVRFRLGESKVYVIDRDAAALTGVIHSTNVDAGGNPTTGHEMWTIVVHRIDGAWRVVQAHESYPRAPAPG